MDSQTMIGSLHELYSQFAEQASELGLTLSKEGQQKADIENTQRQIEAIILVMSERLSPLIRDLEAGPNAERTFGSAYSPESLEPILRLEAMIDGRIDKALGRLVNLKEYKRLTAKPEMLTSKLAGERDRESQPSISHN